jgi:hypothetical protein
VSWVLAVTGGVLLAFGLIGMLLRHYSLSRQLLTPEHLREIAAKLGPVKLAALGRPTESSAVFAPVPADPCLLATRRGLLVYYSLSVDQDLYCHQMLLTVLGGTTPRRAGQTLVFYLAYLLSLPFERMELAISPSTVHHVQFFLNRDEHEVMAARAINTPGKEKMVLLRKQSVKA